MEHPIENLMNTAMSNIKEMIDVNTIIGEPIETTNNIVIIPISKVGVGFASGGSEYTGETLKTYMKKGKDEEENAQYILPFGGGSGAGISITPVAFLVIQDTNVKLIPIDYNSAVEKLLDYVPDLMERISKSFNNKRSNYKKDIIDN